jgi:hypothetical protein
MKQDTMFYIALGTVIDDIGRVNAYTEYASTADTKQERNRYNRLALKAKAKSIVQFDRVMDRLVKDCKNV